MSENVVYLHGQPKPVGHFLRLGTSGHRQLETLLGSGKMMVHRAVVEASAALRQHDLLTALSDAGGELILVNHIGAEGGARRAFELAFAPLARRLGWRPEFPWARLVDWAARHGGVTLAERRPMPPMGHFSLIRYRKA